MGRLARAAIDGKSNLPLKIDMMKDIAAKWLERKKDGLQKGSERSHVKSGGMSKLKASKLYNIPRTTLLRRLKTMDLDSPATKPTVLAIKDEEALVGHIHKNGGKRVGEKALFNYHRCPKAEPSEIAV
ncbi:Hypothetical predicted protein [Mytilus galloprovincialis]|uniref:HTH psq-type domain-containing protein n=1 Tax=Mytilus galloprovincialis TaxID=29158 RepID=A0A8B6DFL0_MYTGA|nr:Hypothetical predicted protein [Mytilus galloprovincialis]